MTAAFGEFQRELIIENTRAGLAAANKQGRLGGRPRSMDDEKFGSLRRCSVTLKTNRSSVMSSSSSRSEEPLSIATFRQSEFERSGESTPEPRTF